MSSNGFQMSSRHILSLTKDEKREFLNSFDIILSDCDGVIWMLVEPIPNTGPAIMSLKRAGKQFKFISNNSLRSDQDYLAKLADIGVDDVAKTDLVHPVKTIIRYLHRHLPGEPVFALCSPLVTETLKLNDVNLRTLAPNTNLRMEDLVNYVKPKDKVAAVVIDWNINLTFAELARAQYYLQSDECRLLVGASDAVVPINKDFITIGTAGFTKILEDSTGTTPIVLGKPGPLLGEDLKEQFNIRESRRALFIGDNLIADIRFGRTCGFQTLFVLTGASTLEHLAATPKEFQPDFYADGMSDFNQFFKDLE